MPDITGKLIQQDMEAALTPAEIAIAEFKAPSAPVSSDPPPAEIITIQEETGKDAAKQRTNALFDFLVQLISQGCNDEIDKKQILQLIGDLNSRVSNIEAILTRNSLV